LADVERSLHSSVQISDDLVEWTSRHLMDAGGKRVRPLMVLLGASLSDLENARVLDAAVLVELTHLASLYHDDVMDEAPTRRGTNTAHEVWGNSVAILTGDFLFARASALSAHLGSEFVQLHARTFERLCLGQLHETVGPKAGEDPFDHYLSVLSDKTASLLALAGEVGVIASNGDPAHADILRKYGEQAGIAFQLADDVLDLRSDSSTSGKRPGTDLREGVATMPVLLVRRQHAAAPTEHSTRLVELLDGDLSEDGPLDEALALLRSDPALEETSAMAQRYAEQATAILASLPAGPTRETLIAFTDNLVHRSA
jgi:heptaprenyl diphosphate synthase